MILTIHIEDIGEVRVSRSEEDYLTRIALSQGGHTIIIVLPAGDVLDAIASKLMLLSLWDNTEPDEEAASILF